MAAGFWRKDFIEIGLEPLSKWSEREIFSGNVYRGVRSGELRNHLPGQAGATRQNRRGAQKPDSCVCRFVAGLGWDLDLRFSDSWRPCSRATLSDPGLGCGVESLAG